MPSLASSCQLDIDKYVGIPYNIENSNCMTLVCMYYRDLGWADFPDGDLIEFTKQPFHWLKHHFKPTETLKQHCLIVCKNIDNTLHVAVYDGDRILHNSKAYGASLRQLPALFFRQNKNTRIYEWRQH